MEAIAKAISIEIGSDYLDSEDIPDEDSILRWCSSLVRKVDKSDILMFSHFTVEEFLTDTKLRDDPLLSEFYIEKDSEENHRKLTKVCLTYLNFSEFSCWDLTDWTETEKDIDKDPFLEYAAVYWPKHFETPADATSLDLMCRLFALTKSNNYLLWLQIYWPDRNCNANVPMAASTLLVAAHLGITELCTWLLDQNADVNAQDQLMGTPLLAAISG